MTVYNYIDGSQRLNNKMSVEGVVLAAGFSSRMGCNKMLLDWGGKSILDRCLESMMQVCSRIVIVGGYRIMELRAGLEPSPQVEIIFNEDFAEGMFSSVKKGIEQIQAEKFFLCPGDYPLINKQTYIDLLSGEGKIIVPTFQERRGHPVLIASCHIEDILGGGYSCLRDFVQTNNPTYLEVSDPGIHLDVDTMQDYKHLVPLGGNPIGEENYAQYLGSYCSFAYRRPEWHLNHGH